MRGLILLALLAAAPAAAIPPPPPPPPPLSNPARDAELRAALADIEKLTLTSSDALANARVAARKARESGQHSDWLTARRAAIHLTETRRALLASFNKLSDINVELYRDKDATAGDHTRMDNEIHHWFEFYRVTEENVSGVLLDLVSLVKD